MMEKNRKPKERTIVLQLKEPVQEVEGGYRFNGESLPKDAFWHVNSKRTIFYFKPGWLLRISVPGVQISRQKYDTTVLAEKIKSIKYRIGRKPRKDR